MCIYHIYQDVFNGRHEDLLRLPQQSMGGQEPIALPQDALARLWAHALRQGWSV
jgi:hypothetical protein